MNFQLDSIIEVLLSSDNQRRIQAEAYVNQIPQTNFEQGIDAFLMSMNHQNQQIASMGALLLKKKYLEVTDNLKMISKEKFQFIVMNVQNNMTPSKPLMFLKRCCQILVKIYSFVNQKDKLVGIIQQLANLEGNNMKLTLLYFIEIICEFAFDDTMLMEYSSGFETIFSNGLGDQNSEIKAASFKTLTIFLSSISDQKMIKKFTSVLTMLVEKAIQLIKYDQQSGLVALESLNELIEAHPNFIKPIFPNLLMIFTEIAEAVQMMTNLRNSALSSILTLCMHHHTLIRKSEYFKTKMVPTYIKMLSEIEKTDMKEWSQELVDEVISKNDIAMATEEHIAQIANELGNKFMLPLFIPFIKQCLSRPEFHIQHAGLVSLALLVQNCHQKYKNQLKNMLGLIMPLLNTEHPRIIFDILFAMGYMCSQFAPQIQQNFGKLILEFIIQSMCHSISKVQYKAVQCIVNFQQGLTDHKEVKVIEPYLDRILGQLAKIFENSLNQGNFIMMEACLESISSIASINPFNKYYLIFMPVLKRIINMVTKETPQKISIRSKTIETMGELLASVKESPELFESDCQEIMQMMMHLQANIDKEDVEHRAIFSVYSHVVEIIKERFINYSDFVFQKAYQALKRNVDFKIVDESQTQKQTKNPNMHKFAKVKLDLKIDGIKNIILNTDTFQQKLESANLLADMSDYMGENFMKYIELMIPVVKELIMFKSARELRANMVEIARCMVVKCNNPEKRTIILGHMFPIVTQALGVSIKVKDHEEVSGMVQVISEWMPFMTQEMSTRIPDMMQAIISMTKALTKEVQNYYSKKQMDEQLNEQMTDQICQVEEVYEYIQEIMNKGKGIAAFDNLKMMFPKEYQFGVQ